MKAIEYVLRHETAAKEKVEREHKTLVPEYAEFRDRVNDRLRAGPAVRLAHTFVTPPVLAGEPLPEEPFVQELTVDGDVIIATIATVDQPTREFIVDVDAFDELIADESAEQ